MNAPISIIGRNPSAMAVMISHAAHCEALRALEWRPEFQAVTTHIDAISAPMLSGEQQQMVRNMDQPM